MADRASHLARTLIARLASLDESLAEAGHARPDRQQRMAAIEKVLAIELGVTDGATISLIEATAPQGLPGRPPAERDLRQFADFLQRRLHAQLSEP